MAGIYRETEKEKRDRETGERLRAGYREGITGRAREIDTGVRAVGDVAGAGVRNLGRNIVESAATLAEGAREVSAGMGAAPVWQDVGPTLRKAKTALGVGGAGIWDTAAGVVEYLTGLKPRRLMPEAGPEFEKAWGVGAPPPVATAPAAITPAPVGSPSAPFPTAYERGKETPKKAPGEAPHPMSKYANIYEALRDMKDYQFKRFVDEHDGISGPEIPGIGYVTTKDKEGHEKIVRVIQNPAERPEEPMTIPQAEVAAKMMAGIGTREDRRLAREEASEARAERNVLLREGIESRKEGTAEATALRRDQGIDRTIAAVGTVTDPDTGDKVVNPGLAIHRLNLMGYKEEDLPKHYKPIWKNVTTAFDKFMTDWEVKMNKGKKATEEQRKAGAKAFEKYLR